jgi:hypothetical protein
LIDIRTRTGLIVKRGSQYLVGRILFSRELRWSDSPYDAWFTRDEKIAEKIRQAVGGELCLFNPVAGQIREVEHG